MNANKQAKRSVSGRGRRGLAWGMTYAVVLSAFLLMGASCTRNDVPNVPKETGSGTSAGTTADTKPSGGMTGGTQGGTPGTGKPLDPGAGTVNPDGDAGDPPAATDKDSAGKSFRSNFMH